MQIYNRDTSYVPRICSGRQVKTKFILIKKMTGKIDAMKKKKAVRNIQTAFLFEANKN
jgi:hypothetical protein